MNSNDMLIVLPTVMIGTLLALLDIRTHRVPRIVVICGILAQLATTAASQNADDVMTVLLRSILVALICAALQMLVSLASPGILGFGDVTATLFLGIGVGLRGIETATLWWFFMGVIGILRFSLAKARGEIAFVPMLFISALLALAF